MDLTISFLSSDENFKKTKRKMSPSIPILLRHALVRMQVDERNIVFSRFSQKELRKLLHMESDTNYYRTIKKLSTQFYGSALRIHIRKPFDVISSIPCVRKIVIDKGTLTFYFYNTVYSFITLIQKAYPVQLLNQLDQFQYETTSRIYELFMEEVGEQENRQPDGTWMFDYKINYLKAALGFLNLNSPKVQREIRTYQATDSDVFHNVSIKNRKFDRVYDLKTRVLDKCQKDIEIAGIHYRYEIITEEQKSTRNTPYQEPVAVRFYVNTNWNVEENTITEKAPENDAGFDISRSTWEGFMRLDSGKQFLEHMNMSEKELVNQYSYDELIDMYLDYTLENI